MLFITDKSPSWLHHPDAETVLKRVEGICSGYSKVCALGESMGACSALILGERYALVARILAVAPQYSVSLPFIHFDKRFVDFGRRHPQQRYKSFAPIEVAKRAQVIFGDACREDAVHAEGFLEAGFSIETVAGAGHLVARHLKKKLPGNRLERLLKSLFDFSLPFDRAAVASSLSY